jgi:hypothetical protein
MSASTKGDPTEGAKLKFEINKHVTTLAAGSSALIATFIGSIFPGNTHELSDIGVCSSFILFFFSLLWAIWNVYATQREVRHGEDGAATSGSETLKTCLRSRLLSKEVAGDRRRLRTSSLIPALLYSIGLAIFVLVVLLNLTNALPPPAAT